MRTIVQLIVTACLIACACCRLHAQDNAAFVSCEVPTSLVTNQVFRGEITMRNTGTTTWGQYAGQTPVTLVSTSPNFNTTWGTYFIIQGQGSSVAPGATFTFGSYLMAPETPGDYTFSWRCQRWIPGGGSVPPDLNQVPFIGAEAVGPVIRVSQRSEQRPPPPPHQEGLLDHTDLDYAGSFLVPGIAGEEDVYTDSALTLRTNGATKQLLLWTGTYHSRLYEIAVPELVKIANKDYSSVKTASLVRDWGLLDYGTIGGEGITATGGMYLDESTGNLYWTHSNGYFTGGPSAFPQLLATHLNADGTKNNIGYWYIPDTGTPYKGYWGGVIKLSQSFSNTYTGGRDLAMGFGGYYSICGTASRGPALGAIARPGASGSKLDLLVMMTYPDPIACPREGNYFDNIGYWSTQPANPWTGSWTGQDDCRAGVFIDLPDKKGYLAFSTQGVGRLGYDYGGYNTDGHYQQCWYFYDIHDLGEAALGQKSVSSLVPISYDIIEYPLRASAVTGACFDPDERLLYLYVKRSLNNNRPIIHVYRITTSSPNHAPVLAPIGSRSVPAGEKIQFTVQGSDADGNVLQHSATGGGQ